MKTSKNGLEFISKWEGCILKPYKDIAGLRTIGIGHLIKPGENFPDGIEITKEKALELLEEDVKICEDSIKKNIKVPLNQNQFDALVSFGFNCGTGVYKTSSACSALNEGKYEEVPERLLFWNKVTIDGKRVVSKGLHNRRISEGQLFSGVVSKEQNSTTTLDWNVDLIKEVQGYLKNLGLYKLSIDGIFGKGTKTGLENFSKQNNISLGENIEKNIPTTLYEKLKDSK